MVRENLTNSANKNVTSARWSNGYLILMLKSSCLKEEKLVRKLTDFVKKLRFGKMLTVLLAGVVLFFMTACNSGDVTGARPNNPPVQAGGQNNPHKSGGDAYTEYNQSTNPGVNRNAANQERNRADLQLTNDRLIAASQIKSDASKLLYPGSDATSTSNPDIGPRGEKELEKAATQIPEPGQSVVKRSNPNEKILEKVGEAFKDASGFLKDKGEEAQARPELQPNPAK